MTDFFPQMKNQLRVQWQLIYLSVFKDIENSVIFLLQVAAGLFPTPTVRLFAYYQQFQGI